MVYCCAVDCHNNTVTHQGVVGFFRFPKKNQEQRELWIKAVKRVNPDGSKWLPSEHSRICSDHFVNGEVHPTRDHPSYKPTIFPTGHVRTPGEPEKSRFERIAKRRKLQNQCEQASLEGKNYHSSTWINF